MKGLINIEYPTFLTNLILNINKNLKEEDLLLLTKLSRKYNVLDRSKEVLSLNIDEIVTYLILDHLQYKTAKYFIIGEKVVNTIVTVNNGTIKFDLPDNSIGWYDIKLIIKDMNDILQDED